MGICADKDLLRCLPLILSICPFRHIHCVSARHPRALEAHQLMQNLYKASQSVNHKCNDVHVPSQDYQHFTSKVKGIRGALRDAINICGKKVMQDDKLHAVVVVFGSAFIMSESRAEMGIIEARDAATLIKFTHGKKQRNKFYVDAQENFNGKL